MVPCTHLYPDGSPILSKFDSVEGLMAARIFAYDTPFVVVKEVIERLVWH